MKIRPFTIPNLLTLANLICGSLAVIAITQSADYRSAFLLIILGAVFDFFDGFAARILNQSSPLGGELDSLADMVSFGLAPGLVMMALVRDSGWFYDVELLSRYGEYIPLIIVAFSALRLAIFNIDESQSHGFVGLPTPACALFCISLGWLFTEGHTFPSEVIAAVSVILALLLISPIKMFALKFKGFGWRGNELRYSFILLSLLLLIVLQLYALPLIVAIYIAVSIVLSLICRSSV